MEWGGRLVGILNMKDFWYTYNFCKSLVIRMFVPITTYVVIEFKIGTDKHHIPLKFNVKHIDTIKTNILKVATCSENYINIILYDVLLCDGGVYGTLFLC